jgi:hypothetical protein
MPMPYLKRHIGFVLQGQLLYRIDTFEAKIDVQCTGQTTVQMYSAGAENLLVNLDVVISMLLLLCGSHSSLCLSKLYNVIAVILVTILTLENLHGGWQLE